MINSRRSVRGFTLMEMLIVIAIIAALVAVAVPVFMSQTEEARQKADLANERSAYAAALAEWMSSSDSGKQTTYYFNGSSAVKTPTGISGYGQSSANASTFSQDLDATVSGIPNDGKPRYLTVGVSPEGKVTMRWNGNDLSTPEGRRQEDIDNMHLIAAALTKAFEEGNLHFQKNYVEVAVFRDGTMAYFNDRWGGESDDQTIIDALESAGLNTTYTALNSEDAKWKNGYVVHFNSSGTVSYKPISDAENESHEINWNWWNKGNITDEDLVGSDSPQ